MIGIYRLRWSIVRENSHSDLWVMRTTAYLLALSLQSFGSFLFIRVSYCLGVSVVGRVVEGSQKLPNQMEPFSFFRVRSFAG